MLLKILGILFILMVLGPLLAKIIRLFALVNGAKANRHQRKTNHRPADNSPKPPKKFNKGEGEYVSYEEVKDEE